MPRPEDLDRVRHMIDAAREAMGFLEGRSRHHLTSDRKLQLAVIHLLAIIGEAAGRLSPRAQAIAPEVPWPEVVGMRNRLVHRYFEIDFHEIWDTVQDDLPTLVPLLEGLLRDLEAGR